MKAKKGWWDFMTHEILSQKDMNIAENMISNFLKKTNFTIPKNGWLDIIEFATSLGFSCNANETVIEENLDGVVYVDEEKGIRYIGFNSDRDIEVIRFIVAHELSHYIENRMEKPNKKVTIALRHNFSEERDDKEQLIDYMGVCLLVPADHFKSEIEKYNFLNWSSEEIIGTLAAQYQVTQKVIERRIYELNLKVG